jgi:hypothetical protein
MHRNPLPTVRTNRSSQNGRRTGVESWELTDAHRGRCRSTGWLSGRPLGVPGEESLVSPVRDDDERAPARPGSGLTVGIGMPGTWLAVEEISGGGEPPDADVGCGCRQPLIWDGKRGYWRHLADGSPCREGSRAGRNG